MTATWITRLRGTIERRAKRLHAMFHFKVWYGIGFGTWIHLLGCHGLMASPAQIPRIVLFTLISIFNSLEPLAKRRKADRLRVVGDRRRGALSLHVIT